MTPETLNYILGGISIITTGAYLYNSLRKPQEKSRTIDALLEQRIKLEKDESDRRFSEIGKRMDEALTLAQNHTHTVDVKVDKLTGVVGDMGKEITKLTTIIEERIPKK